MGARPELSGARSVALSRVTVVWASGLFTDENFSARYFIDRESGRLGRIELRETTATAQIGLELAHLDVVLPIEMDDVGDQRSDAVAVVTIGQLGEKKDLVVAALGAQMRGSHGATIIAFAGLLR